MENITVEEALRYAAMAEAYTWYCERHGIGDLDNVSDQEMARQAEAWAWARRNWDGFVPDTDSPHTQFLIELFCGSPAPGELFNGNRYDDPCE